MCVYMYKGETSFKALAHAIVQIMGEPSRLVTQKILSDENPKALSSQHPQVLRGGRPFSAEGLKWSTEAHAHDGQRPAPSPAV